MQISFFRELFRNRNHRIGTEGMPVPRYRKREIENQDQKGMNFMKKKERDTG